MFITSGNTNLVTNELKTESTDYLFVYGTLQPAFDNEFSQYLRQHSRYLSEGYMPGLLVDLGDYPGAVYRPDHPQFVRGTVYEISRHKDELLTYLDDYEGIGNYPAETDEYVRVVLPVVSNDDIVSCWAYLYDLPIDGKTLINSGDYTRYINQIGIQ